MSNKYNLHKTVSDYIKESDTEQIKTDLLCLFEKVHGHKDIQKVLYSKNLFEPIEIHEVHNKYASFLGRWSEYFIWMLKQNGVDYSDFLINVKTQKIEDLLDSKNLTELSIAQSIQKYKNKTHVHRRNRSEDWEKDFFKAGWPISLLNENVEFFKRVVIHFRDKVFPHTENFLNNSDFFQSEKCKNVYECNIQGWEFDFYDDKNKMVVDFKFQQIKFSKQWFWQTLLYVYLLDFYYKVRPNGIKIINTCYGIEYSATLVDLFGEKGSVDFFKICRLAIPDKEKYEFQAKTKLCYQNFFDTKTVTHNMIKQIYLLKNELEIEKIKKFVEDLFCNYDDLTKNDEKEGLEIQNIETKLRSVNWLWARWMEWDENYSELID